MNSASLKEHLKILYIFLKLNFFFNRSTSLGNFEKFENNIMYFEHGQRCWSGPERSIKVPFSLLNRSKLNVELKIKYIILKNHQCVFMQ